jgi:hypothetical protein
MNSDNETDDISLEKPFVLPEQTPKDSHEEIKEDANVLTEFLQTKYKRNRKPLTEEHKEKLKESLRKARETRTDIAVLREAERQKIKKKKEDEYRQRVENMNDKYTQHVDTQQKKKMVLEVGKRVVSLMNDSNNDYLTIPNIIHKPSNQPQTQTQTQSNNFIGNSIQFY